MVSTAIAVAVALLASSAPPDDGVRLDGDLTVFAAASLTESFEALGEEFEAAHPGVDVTLSFAASSQLAQQVLEGAPADVVASADIPNMDRLVEGGGARGEPVVFASNSLAILVEAGNPRDIDGLAELSDDDLIVVSCDPAVPIGAYTQEVFGNAGAEIEIDSYEENVRAVVSKVLLGEADAGVVYVTDVLAAGDDATGVPIPADVNVVADYPIAVTAEADEPELAAAFVDFVVGDEAQAILAAFGFGTPDASIAPVATTEP
jgi:molybdate transport system substrate-binding protein